MYDHSGKNACLLDSLLINSLLLPHSNVNVILKMVVHAVRTVCNALVGCGVNVVVVSVRIHFINSNLN